MKVWAIYMKGCHDLRVDMQFILTPHILCLLQSCAAELYANSSPKHKSASEE